jgi:formylglycine-generating enzyme required for sulfatase activity
MGGGRSWLRFAVALGVLAVAAHATRQAGGDVAGAVAGDESTIAGIELCWCPPGRFLMGSPADEPDRRPGEDQVGGTLSRGFWIGKYEVTQAEWRRVVGAVPGKLETGEGNRFPIYGVTFAQAENFCRRLTEQARRTDELKAGWEFRLPTEAQWEYACRAGTTTATAFGNALSSTQANFNGEFPYGDAAKGPAINRTAAVGSYPANAWNLHDTHGNVLEWCRDWSHTNLPGGTDPDLSNRRAGSRIRCGGCFADEGFACRSAARVRSDPAGELNRVGFRVVAVEVK